MTPDDQLSAALDEIRSRSRECAPERYYQDWAVPRQHLAASAADVPHLLAAIEATLILLGEARGCCYNCGTVPTAWENFDPAGVRATILANLTGEARDDPAH